MNLKLPPLEPGSQTPILWGLWSLKYFRVTETIKKWLLDMSLNGRFPVDTDMLFWYQWLPGGISNRLPHAWNNRWLRLSQAGSGDLERCLHISNLHTGRRYILWRIKTYILNWTQEKILWVLNPRQKADCIMNTMCFCSGGVGEERNITTSNALFQGLWQNLICKQIF